MKQIDQVYKVVVNSNNPLTSVEIVKSTGLTPKQVGHALFTLKVKGWIFSEREIEFTKFNRYKQKPQRWALTKDMFDGTND